MTRSAIIAALFAAAGSVSAQFNVTEAYIGISGEDGTNDWFEITNIGTSVLDTSTLLYDDDTPTPSSAGQLDSFLLNAGESAVFLIGDFDTDDLADFTAVWGSVANVGFTNGGGNLGQGGDSINISSDSGVSFPFSLLIPDGAASDSATLDNVTTLTDSVLGVNGAFESNPFFNDNIGGPNNEVTLIGSPGVIPAPASAALLGLGGLVAARRRR
ncbi:MAG: VPLPA-CTERM sorting domain-containing protein [Planctomycetota bacterium]